MTDDEDVAAGFSVPTELADVLGQSSAAPSVGQLWRANWDGALVLVCIAAHEPSSQSLVFPVTVGSTEADSSATIVDETRSPLGVTITVWSDLQTLIPDVVFDRYLGSCSDELLQDLADPTRADKFRVGLPVVNEASRRAYARKILRDQVDVLANATSAEPDPGSAEASVLAQELSLKELVAAGFPVPRALQIARRQADLTDDERQRIESINGTFASHATTVLPENLVNSGRQQRWSSPIRRISAREHLPESDSWARVMRGAYALAARQKSDDTDDVWADRIQTFLETSA